MRPLHVVEGLLTREAENVDEPRPPPVGIGDTVDGRSGIVERGLRPHGKHLLGAHMILEGEPELFEVVRTARFAGRLPGRLYRRQQEPDEHRDDGDHGEEFDERKTAAAE